MAVHKFDPDQIFNDCARNLGLERFADVGMKQRFRDLIAMFNDFGSVDDDHLSAAIAQFTHVVGARLKLARDWEEHPEILEQKIVQPFFVIGNARAGTTLAQTVLSLADGHRTPRYWEVRHPSPPPGGVPASDAASREDESDYVRYILAASPRLLQAHPYFDQGPDTEAEDEYLHAFDFHTPYPLPYLKVPSLPQGTTPRDPVAAMRFHKKMWQQLQWQVPTKRWVGKGVVHQYMLPAVLEVYPDAICFWMHRAPEDYIPSLLELLEVQYKPFNRDLYRVVPRDLVNQLRQGVDHILRSESTHDPRIHHIRFNDFVSDRVAVISNIYANHGLEFTDSFHEKIVRHFDNKVDRYGKFTYSAETYGFTRGELRSMFADYCERFGL
jgi:hypothetical protein